MEFVKSEEDEEDDKADWEEDKLEGAPGPADGLLAETDLDARILPVLEPLVDHEDDVEDGGDEAKDHQGVVLLAGGGALADVAKKLKKIYEYGLFRDQQFLNVVKNVKTHQKNPNMAKHVKKNIPRLLWWSMPGVTSLLQPWVLVQGGEERRATEEVGEGTLCNEGPPASQPLEKEV